MKHSLICPIRSRWRRWRYHQPFWAQDKTAKMLGVSTFGCPRCGYGAIEERDALQRLADAVFPPAPKDADTEGDA